MKSTPAYCPVCQQTNICTWCIAKDYEYFSTAEEYTYFHCNDCKSIFIHPIPLDQLKKIYPPNYYSFVNKPGNIVVRLKEWLDKRFFKKILAKIDSPEINVLDIGGGTGWILDVLKSADPRIVNTQIVDIDKEASSIAEKKGHAYYTGTIENFDTKQ